MRFSTAISILSVIGAVSAHPGEVEQHGTLARREFLDNAKRSIAGCQGALAARGVEARAIQRRKALAESLREKRSLRKRDFANSLATDHKSNRTDLTADSTGADVFTGNLSCVLQAEVTVGPYWVSGELVRSNVTEGQGGVALYTDFQLINVNTCEPIEGVYVDSWHANSTGVYAGIVAQGNGDATDLSNINSTFGRGIQVTDADGVVYFEDLVPGHYTGRTNHIHVLATIGATLLPNNTLSGGNISHVGQVFFDQDLLTTVEATSPYSGNTQEQLGNANDGIFAEEAATTDPVLQYVYLGDDVTDGILAWISIGIDPSAEYTVGAAATWTENGGVANPNAGGGGPGGPGGPPSGGGGPGGPRPTSSAVPTSSAA